VLRRHGEVLRTLLRVADLALVSASWLAAYWIRFHTSFEAPLGPGDFRSYAAVLLVIVPLWFQLLRSRGLYDPQRTGSLLRESGAVIGASAVGVLTLAALTFFARRFEFSRAVLGLFFVLSATSLVGFRVAARLALRAARRRGHNLRHVLGVGAGDAMRQFVASLRARPEVGLRMIGVLADKPVRSFEAGVPVLGGYAQLKSVLREHRIDQVVVALPREDAALLEKVLADLDDEFVSVRIVPDLLHVMTVQSSVEEIDGLPVICLRESPLVGWAAVEKRAFDVVVTGLALLLGAPFLLAIALAVRLTSGSPVLYGQERMGLDGRLFRMLKFRTMVHGAEQESGPVWTVEDDPRRTRLGAFLRRTSLDELPQLWNVLRGDMSLVGPRPERPVFIEQFRREVPGYMLRHKVKAGVTGWAQVHGWRGNTSLHERVEHDLFYIQNWSLGLDLRILLMTLWRGVLHRNAY